MDPYSYVLRQVQKDGVTWKSSEVFTGDLRAVRQAVIAGYLAGEPRWAETPHGFFLYGLDRLGKPHETGTVSPDFS